MSDPLVHALVINWNGLEHLDACFSSLLESPYPNVKYILVDNASDDDSVAFVRERFSCDARVGIVSCPANLGWSGGNNFAIKRSLAEGAEYLFLLNNDTATAPDAIEKLVAMAEARQAIGALAPKMLMFDHPELINSVGLECSLTGCSWDKGIGRLDAPRWNTSTQVIGVCGGACFLRAEALHKTGLFPEDFEIYLDDLDLCMRLWNAGYEIWSCPEAVVRHKFSATFGAGPRARRKYYLNTRNRIRILMRGFPLLHLPRVKLVFLIGECRALGRAVLDGAYWRIGAHLRAWASGLGYWPRALAERWRRRRTGLGTCRFWPLLRTDRMFSPGVALPENGWYAEREVHGLGLRPMGARAWADVQRGSLRLSHANCYPDLGDTKVSVSLNGEVLTELSTSESAVEVVEVQAGRLEFKAMAIFDADQTGEIMDLGGWIGIETL